MDGNIRERIELVLEIKLEDGEDIEAIEKASNIQANPATRKWEILTPLLPRPQLGQRAVLC
jgi:hypothetical protein